MLETTMPESEGQESLHQTSPTDFLPQRVAAGQCSEK